MATEHRKNDRRPINLPMVYTALDGSGGVLAQGVGRALDVSPNGIMVGTREPIRDKHLRIRVSISDEKSIAIEGMLIYSIRQGPAAYRTGIKLVGTDESVSQFIAELQLIKSPPSN